MSLAYGGQFCRKLKTLLLRRKWTRSVVDIFDFVMSLLRVIVNVCTVCSREKMCKVCCVINFELFVLELRFLHLSVQQRLLLTDRQRYLSSWYIFFVNCLEVPACQQWHHLHLWNKNGCSVRCKFLVQVTLMMIIYSNSRVHKSNLKTHLFRQDYI